MTARITCTTTVATAHRATTSLAGLWSDAYAAIARDVAGGATLRDISDALKRAGVKASKDIVGDMALAATLTASPTFAAHHADRVGADRIMLAHSLITRARTARGIAYVRTVLATLDGLTGEDLDTATRKAVRDLHAAKRAAKPAESTGEETGEETASEETGETVAPTPTAATADTCLRSAASILEGVIKSWNEGSDVPSDDAVTAFLAVAARLATMGKARRDRAVAV